MITFISGVTIGPPPATYIEIFDSVKNETYRFNIADGISPKNQEDRVLAIFQEGVITYQCLFVDISNPAGTVAQKFNAISELFIVDIAISGTVAISAVSLPLPTGASTSANQTTEITALGTIVTNTTGLATAVNQTTEITALTAIGGTLTSIDSGIPTALGQTTMAASMPVTIASNQTTLGVSVSNAITISGTVPISAAALPLPTGASTSANQTTEITALTAIGGTLTSIDSGIPTALGQTTMINSMPCVIASNQSAIPVTGASTAATNFGNDRSVDNAASVSFTTIGTKYAMLGLSLGTTTGVNLIDISTFFATSDRLIIEVIQDPTVAGTFTYAAISNSLCLLAIGDVTNTVTSGTILYKTLISGKDSLVQFTLISSLNKVIQAGTTKLVIAVTPLVSNVSVRGILNFKENV